MNTSTINLIPRFSLLPVDRPWLGMALCLPESGRLQTNDLGEGQISVRFVSAECRLFLNNVLRSSHIIQDKTSNAENNAQNHLRAKA